MSNCSKQLVTPVNLTRNYFLTNYLISSIVSELPKLKTAFNESHFPHCAVLHKSCQKMPTANQLDRISLGFLDHRYLRNLLHAIPMSSLHLIKLPIIHVTTSSCGQCILKRSYYVKPFFFGFRSSFKKSNLFVNG